MFRSSFFDFWFSRSSNIKKDLGAGGEITQKPRSMYFLDNFLIFVHHAGTIQYCTCFATRPGSSFSSFPVIERMFVPGFFFSEALLFCVESTVTWHSQRFVVFLFLSNPFLSSIVDGCSPEHSRELHEHSQRFVVVLCCRILPIIVDRCRSSCDRLSSPD